MKKDAKQIKKAVEQAREAVKETYKDDARAKDPKHQTADSGFTKETQIVFTEALKYYLSD